MVKTASMTGYLRLVRLPNVFTALADILTGHLIMGAMFGESSPRTLLPLGGASAALYLSGMAFNDIADRKEDAQFRPNRPLPSGQVSMAGAVACGALLMALGIGLACSAGRVPLNYAFYLAAAILLYDFAAKGIPVIGPAALGFCRFYNLQLGMSAHPDFVDALATFYVIQVPWSPALAVGIYAAGLTAFSAQEETGKQVRSIVTGWIFCGLGIALATLTAPTKWGWLLIGPLLLLLVYLSVRLLKTGTPGAARNLVRAGVMGICALDAGMILGFGELKSWPYALACLGLLVPGLAVGKWLAQKEA